MSNGKCSIIEIFTQEYFKCTVTYQSSHSDVFNDRMQRDFFPINELAFFSPSYVLALCI